MCEIGILSLVKDDFISQWIFNIKWNEKGFKEETGEGGIFFFN